MQSALFRNNGPRGETQRFSFWRRVDSNISASTMKITWGSLRCTLQGNDHISHLGKKEHHRGYISMKWDECDTLDKVSQKTSFSPQIHRFPITEKFMDKHLPWMFFHPSDFQSPFLWTVAFSTYTLLKTNISAENWCLEDAIHSLFIRKKNIATLPKKLTKWLAGKTKQPFHDH